MEGTSSYNSGNDSFELLQGFMLGGIYFLKGWGGITNVIETSIKRKVTSKPGSRLFTEELINGYKSVLVYPFRRNEEETPECQEMLRESWDINNREELLYQLDSLIQYGHNVKFQQIYNMLTLAGGPEANFSKLNKTYPDGTHIKFDDIEEEDLIFVKNNFNKFSKAGIKAWDYARYVNNICMGYGAEYITHEEGVSLVKKIMPDVLQQYNNWDTYFNDWLLGRIFWNSSSPKHVAYMLEMDNISNKAEVYNIYNHIPLNKA